MSIIKSTLFTLSTQIFTFVIGIFTSIIVVRTIGAEGRGIIELLNNYFGIIVSIFSLSLHSSIVYYINKSGQTKKYFSTLITFTIVVSVILIFINFLFQNIILSNVLRNVPSNLFVIGNVLIILLLLERSLFGYVRAINDVKTYNINQIGRKLIYLLFILVIFFTVKTDLVFWVFVALLLTNMIFNTTIILKYSNHIKWFSFDCKSFKELFNFGIKEHIGVITQKLNLRFDIIIMGMFLNVKEIGYYSIGVLFSELLWYMTDALGVFLFPKISKKVNDDLLVSYVAQVNRINLLLTFITLLFLLVLGCLFIPIFYGVDFNASISPFIVLCFGSATLTIPKVLTKYFVGIGRPQYASYCSIAGLIVNIPALIILIPALGIMGAAVASTLTYSIICIYACITFKIMAKKHGLNNINFLLINKNDVRFIIDKIKFFR